MIEVIIKTRTIIGKGELANIPKLLYEYNYQKFGFIIDPVFKGDLYVNELLSKIENEGLLQVVYYYDLPFEPDYDSLDRVKFKFKNSINNEALVDIIVAIGGGSVIDFAKGISTLVNNHEPALFYKGFPKDIKPSVPVVAVPTTAGTASEVTYNAVFTDTKIGRKLGINTFNNFPVLAILDSNMTRNCPSNVALSSGLDALVHAFESFACKKSNYYTRIFAKESISYLLGNILPAILEPQNDKARENMLFGAYLAGISLYNAGSGPAGAISYPLGVLCKVPHGLAGGFVLPYLIEHNVNAGYMEYSEIARYIGLSSGTDSQASELLVKKLFDLYDKLNVWSYKSKYYVDIKNDNELKNYLSLLQGAFDQNPVPFSIMDAEKIINKIFN
jgi:alcohol dehydrogenase class IV